MLSPMREAYVSTAPEPEDGPRLVAKIRQSAAVDCDWTQDVAAFQAPTLIVVGDADTVLPSHAGEMFGLLGGGTSHAAMGNLSNAQLAVLPGTTHFSILARRELLLAIISPFLDAPVARRSRPRPRRSQMPQPILCLDEEVSHFAKRFDVLFSRPQYQYLVTVLLGLMECDGKRTLSGLLHEVGQALSLSGLSRFFSQAPWEPGAVVACWLRHFRAEMQPQGEAKREQERKAQPKRRGRPNEPLATGYLIGHDTTMTHPK